MDNKDEQFKTPQRHRGPMGRGPMGAGEKAKDFKRSIGKLMKYTKIYTL